MPQWHLELIPPFAFTRQTPCDHRQKFRIPSPDPALNQGLWYSNNGNILHINDKLGKLYMFLMVQPLGLEDKFRASIAKRKQPLLLALNPNPEKISKHWDPSHSS